MILFVGVCVENGDLHRLVVVVIILAEQQMQICVRKILLMPFPTCHFRAFTGDSSDASLYQLLCCVCFFLETLPIRDLDAFVLLTIAHIHTTSVHIIHVGTCMQHNFAGQLPCFGSWKII